MSDEDMLSGQPKWIRGSRNVVILRRRLLPPRAKKTSQKQNFGQIVYFIVSNLRRFFYVLLLIVVLIVFLGDFHQQSLLIESISVPKSLQDMGYTEQVVGSRLRDAIIAKLDHLHTSKLGPSPLLNDELAGIVVPNTSFSLETVAIYMRKFVGQGLRKTVSGAVVAQQDTCEVTLRLDGAIIYTAGVKCDLANLETSLQVAATAILNAGYPYYAALDAYESDPAHADEKIKLILATLPRSDESTPWIESLQAMISSSSGNDKSAIAELNSILKQNSKASIADQDLAIIYEKQKRFPEAIEQINRAIAIDNDNPRYHAFAGQIQIEGYDATHNDEWLTQSVQQFRLAVDGDTRNAQLRYALADSLVKRSGSHQKDLDDQACEQLRTAQILDSPHERLTNRDHFLGDHPEARRCFEN